MLPPSPSRTLPPERRSPRGKLKRTRGLESPSGAMARQVPVRWPQCVNDRLANSERALQRGAPRRSMFEDPITTTSVRLEAAIRNHDLRTVASNDALSVARARDRAEYALLALSVCTTRGNGRRAPRLLRRLSSRGRLFVAPPTAPFCALRRVAT